ncbi:hypothetical protein Tco_0935795, partial [Tanacetum coccineum]
NRKTNHILIQFKHRLSIRHSIFNCTPRNNPTPLEAFKEHSEIVINFNDDSTSSDDDSPYGEDIDYVDASPPDYELVSLEVVENVTPEDGEIEDDVLREKLSKINLLIAKIKALKDNPPLSSSFVTNGSTTTRSDYSFLDYETFYLDDDHVEEKSSGSTTTHADFSQYDSFIFDLSINSCPSADRSDCYHEEFAGELAHIISPPEYDCFSILRVHRSGTDIKEMDKNQSKNGQSQTREGKSAQEPGIIKLWSTKVNPGQQWWHAIQQMELMLGSKANIEGLGLEILDAPQGPR